METGIQKNETVMTPEQWKAQYKAEAEAYIEEHGRNFATCKQAQRIADPEYAYCWIFDCIQNSWDGECECPYDPHCDGELQWAVQRLVNIAPDYFGDKKSYWVWDGQEDTEAQQEEKRLKYEACPVHGEQNKMRTKLIRMGFEVEEIEDIEWFIGENAFFGLYLHDTDGATGEELSEIVATIRQYVANGKATRKD